MVIKTAHVSVRSHARLHFGFMDMHGGMGRMYGSLGLALSQPCTVIRVSRSRELQVTGPASERALVISKKLWPVLGDGGGVRVAITQTIPSHNGLGSGTQLALSLAAAFCRLTDSKRDIRELARLTGRGSRSGIGLATFRQGGLILDAGTEIKGNDAMPPVLSRLAFPKSWRIVLIFDQNQQGLHGSDENNFFNQPPQMEAAVSAAICRLVVLRLLPAVAIADCYSFGAALSELQRYNGDYFAAAQGGSHFSSKETGAAVAWLMENGATGGGQSSWGPTGFAVFPTSASATAAADMATAKWGSSLRFVCTPACNTGAAIRLQQS